MTAKLSDVPAYMLPAPSDIMVAMQSMWGLLFIHSGITLAEIGIGFVLATLIGVPLATLITYSHVFDRAVYPLIVGSQTIPKVAIAPLLLAGFGYGLAPKVAIVTLIAFFPIVINTVVGLRSVPAEMLHLARSMGATPLQAFWKFRLPQALPSIFAGLKLASVLAVIGAVVAEFVGANGGLGYIIMIAGSNFRMDQQFAAIIFLSAIGMVFFWLIGLAERAMLPWHISVRSASEKN
ncbi:ABC transporter permease [Pelagibacterium lacus]|uniref:ABC transporter permease n=2 Tax=Pelagibacterium lacus TaxID=2282655 RepID=A0A369W4S4_9HYPH|nr:ABC transporter permease [Pelagibacterium lacus]